MDGIVPGSDDVRRWELALQEAGANIDSVKEYKESELIDFSKTILELVFLYVMTFGNSKILSPALRETMCRCGSGGVITLIQVHSTARHFSDFI